METGSAISQSSGAGTSIARNDVTPALPGSSKLARAEEDDAKMGDVVSGELNALVKRRLNDAGVR